MRKVILKKHSIVCGIINTIKIKFIITYQFVLEINIINLLKIIKFKNN